MAKFIPGPYLDGKVEIEFDQGDERDKYEVARAAREGPYPEGADPGSDGYCTTAALYWIKTHRKLRSTPLEGSDKGARGKDLRQAVHDKLLGKRDTLYPLHDAANDQLDATKRYLADSKEKLARRQAKLVELAEQFQSQAAELRARVEAMRNAKNGCNVTLEERDALRARNDELMALRDKIQTKQAKQNQLARDTDDELADIHVTLGNTEIERVYADVADHFGLRFAGGEQKQYAPQTIGAEVKGSLRPGGYYLINFREEDGRGHSMAAFVSPINGNKGGKLHLFDPNLGTYKCTVEDEGGNLIREISNGYKQDDTKTLLFSEVRVFEITSE
jgi:hypothetical protein